MCTVLIGLRVHPAFPLIVAANRDEYYAREALPPRLLSADPWVVGGQDAVAGGTWLGMNRWGVVGLTNQPSPGVDPAAFRSRGALVLEALASADARTAIERVLEPGVAYQPCNLFSSDGTHLYVAYHRLDRTWIEQLEPGWHVLPNGHADHRAIPKVVRAFSLLEALPPDATPEALVPALRSILADHMTPPDAPDEPRWLPQAMRSAIGALCVHTAYYGTRSYSILMVGEGAARYWHGEGPPCTAAPEEVSLDPG